ncbi:hypothetical protein TrVE_jg4951 [Triparma verrucosa]|uniref:Tyrosine-protein kinase ephrin type A/B receptor-like domain-containing protein n=1 Tax=Triparma verrucosa TaxID=1606542 RepID=A0A9W7FFU4_9STRA|nr:hypothetical protein TrVE_jg4951 [Triparma verrucosa]
MFGSSTCLVCDGPGEYSDEGAGFCETCPQYETFLSETNICDCQETFTRIDGICTCIAGETLVDGKCVACDDGRYKDHAGTHSCTVCDTSNIKGAFDSVPGVEKTSPQSCACGVGKFSDGAVCKDCAESGVNCTTVGLMTETLPMFDGFWRTSSSSTEVLPCLNPKHCKGGADTTDLCSDGYTGPLCAVCTSGYAATGSGKSLECSVCTGDAQTTIIFYSSLLLGMYLVINFIYCCCCRRNSTERAPTQSRRSISHSSSSFADGISRIRSTTVDARSTYKGLVKAKGPVLKVLVSYYQVMTMLPFVLNLSFPPVFTTVSNLFSSVVNLNFISLMPLGCIMPSDFHHQMVGYTVIPLVIGLIMIVAYAILKRYESTIPLSNEIFASFLFMTFLILPSVSIQIFSTFACRDFDGDYGSYLKVDYSIDCDAPSRNFYWYYACVMGLIYPIGIPVLY